MWGVGHGAQMCNSLYIYRVYHFAAISLYSFRQTVSLPPAERLFIGLFSRGGISVAGVHSEGAKAASWCLFFLYWMASRGTSWPHCEGALWSRTSLSNTQRDRKALETYPESGKRQECGEYGGKTKDQRGARKLSKFLGPARTQGIKDGTDSSLPHSLITAQITSLQTQERKRGHTVVSRGTAA